MNANDILNEFVERARSWADRRGGSVRFPALGNNTMRVQMAAADVLLYVKVRSEAPGFWGLTRNRLDEFRQLEDAWAVVLLAAAPDHGYLIPGLAVGRRTAAKVWRLGRDGDFKVHEGAELDEDFRFAAVEECLQRAVGLSG